MKKYLVQAILIDNTGRETIETVINSIRTDDDKAAVEYLMKKHRSSNNYLYNVMDLETQEIIISTTRNIYQRTW